MQNNIKNQTQDYEVMAIVANADKVQSEALEKRNTGRSGEGEDDGEVVVGVAWVVDEGKIEGEYKKTKEKTYFCRSPNGAKL